MGTERARELRSNPGEPERAMWQLLYSFRRQGYHFRRQVPIGPYYADFACHHAHLVIEVDGDSHATTQSYDATRDAFMRAKGFTVLRFWNNDVVTNPDGVFAILADSLASIPPLTPTPVPSPQGGGRPRSRKLRAAGNLPDGPQP